MDRFYGSAELIRDLNRRNWGYRLRLKGNLTVDAGDKSCAAGELAQNVTPKGAYFNDALLTEKLATCNLGIVHEKGHDEPWITEKRRGFSDFKTRCLMKKTNELGYAVCDPDRPKTTLPAGAKQSKGRDWD